MDTTVHPPVVSALEYVISDWLGDDLLECFPCHLASDRLADAIELSGLTGYRIDQVRVTLSPQAEEALEGTPLPAFRWLIAIGVAGVDDFGATAKGEIVVSDDALNLLRSFTIQNCDVTGYTTIG
ncbi:hypothetical protein [Longispora fulva]|uniref:Uncharacterized protein n=1 Tax=Longispora fulva TaxID=619741 RepID=A0A8J7KIE0_9ACTN|nr:hypothetical protein [Longispora fulva]MBG6136069.1 hypothetical protein [Longispora fulva]